MTKSTSVILPGLNNQKQWYKDTLATMPYQIYKYFELDTIALFDKLIASAKSEDKLTLKRVEKPQVWKACLDRNQKQQNIYYKEYNIH